MVFPIVYIETYLAQLVEGDREENRCVREKRDGEKKSGKTRIAYRRSRSDLSLTSDRLQVSFLLNYIQSKINKSTL